MFLPFENRQNCEKLSKILKIFTDNDTKTFGFFLQKYPWLWGQHSCLPPRRLRFNSLHGQLLFFLYDLCALNFWDKCFTIWIAKATKIIFILTYVYDYFISVKLKQMPDVSANENFHIWSMKSFSYFQILIFCGLIHFKLDLFWSEQILPHTYNSFDDVFWCKKRQKLKNKEY